MKTTLAILIAAACAGSTALRASDPAQSTDITSDTFSQSAEGGNTLRLFTGHVHVKGDGLDITCDRLKTISTEKGKAAPDASQLQYLVATGHVHILQAAHEGSCDMAEVFPAERKLVLSGNPKVVDHEKGGVYSGEPLVLRAVGKDYSVEGKNVHIQTATGLKELGLPEGPALPPKP